MSPPTGTMKYCRVYLVLLCVFSCSGLSQSLDCPVVCKCEENVTNVVCDLSKTNDIRSLSFSNNTRTLDLSGSGLTRVPSELFVNLTKLEVLSLAGNNITMIQENAFKHLIGLNILNLTDVNLSEWKGQIYPELPSLKIIDLTGNVHWRPDKRLLNVSSLQQVMGVTWSDGCHNCILTWVSPPLEVSASSKFVCNQGMIYFLRGFKTSYTKTCSEDMCRPACKEKRDVVHKRLKKKSYDKGRYFYSGYAVGGLAIFLNLTVLVNILLSKAMRRELSMYLIANMATCDIMIGIYVVLISKHNVFLDAIKQIGNSQGIIYAKHCQGSTILLTVGEIVSLMTALLLTIEKYKCIVYCMKPDIRLRKKHAFITILIAWVVSFLFAVSPHFGFIDLGYSPSLLCFMPVNKGEKPTFIVYPLAIMAVNYMLMLPMYLRIFLYVRRSSNAMGLHRSAALAKQLFIMIGSNFLFFAVPMILLVINVLLYQGHEETIIDQPIKDHIVYIWLPITFLGINSVLNPFLYAFRRKTFQREFIKNMCCECRVSQHLRQALTSLTLNHVSSPGSRTELYDMHSQRKDQETNHRRSGLDSQIPTSQTNEIVLCSVNDYPQNKGSTSSAYRVIVG